LRAVIAHRKVVDDDKPDTSGADFLKILFDDEAIGRDLIFR
jgi:hypothetical protein